VLYRLRHPQTVTKQSPIIPPYLLTYSVGPSEEVFLPPSSSLPATPFLIVMSGASSDVSPLTSLDALLVLPFICLFPFSFVVTCVVPSGTFSLCAAHFSGDPTFIVHDCTGFWAFRALICEDINCRSKISRMTKFLECSSYLSSIFCHHSSNVVPPITRACMASSLSLFHCAFSLLTSSFTSALVWTRPSSRA
jgi:hypothetical protein